MRNSDSYQSIEDSHELTMTAQYIEMEKNFDRSRDDIIIDSSRPMLSQNSPLVEFEKDVPSHNDQKDPTTKPEFESAQRQKPSTPVLKNTNYNQVHPQPNITAKKIPKAISAKGNNREEKKYQEVKKPLYEKQQDKIHELVQEEEKIQSNDKIKPLRNQVISQSKVDFSPNVLTQPYPSPSTQIGAHQMSEQQVDDITKKVPRSSRSTKSNKKVASSKNLAMQPGFSLRNEAKQPNYDSNSEIIQEFGPQLSEVDDPSTEPFQRGGAQDKVAILAEMNTVNKVPTFKKQSEESPMQRAKTRLTKVQQILETAMEIQSEIKSQFGAATLEDMIKDELIGFVNQKKIENESAAAQKRDYIKKYGIEFEIPSLYVQSSVIYKKDPQYSVQVVNYVVPESSEYIVKCHDIDCESEPDKNTFKNIYSERIDGYALRFIKSDKYLRTIEIESEKIFQRTSAKGEAVQIVKIYFSEDQKYFFMWLDLIDELEIYAVESFQQLQEDIEQQKCLIKIDQGLSFVKRIEFDRNGRFFYAINDRKLAIFNLEKLIKDPKSHKPIEYQLNEKYEMIYDVNLSSTSDSQFDCLVVAKLFAQKKFHIFNIENELLRNSVNFFDEISNKLTVKLITDEKTFKAIVINGQEKFQICGEKGSNLQLLRKNLPQLGNKNVISIIRNLEIDENKEENYYILACDTFDNRYHIFNTQDQLYHEYIDRKIPTDQMHVFDLHVDSEKGLHIHSMLDGEFILDKIDLAQPEDNQKYSNLQTSAGAFCIGWPYICFSGFKNRLMIINLFERKTLHRVQVTRGDEKTQICKTFITSTKDMFVVVLQKDHYVLYMLDLDTCNDLEIEEEEKGLKIDRFKFTKIFEYSAEEVNYQTLDDIFVRGSSRKELIQLNNNLMVFLLHNNQLFSWSESKKGEQINKLQPVNDIKENLIIQSKLCIQSDQNFLFCQKSTHLEDSISSICQISLKYNDFEQKIICQENSPKFDFIKFDLDRQNNVLILILQIKDKEKYYVKIYDFDEEKMIYESILSNQEPKLRELLTSGAYILVDGHMYFNNNVFKIRYDLMKKYQSRQLDQNQFFNEYQDILELGENQQIKLDCPVVSDQGHKFMYIAFNPVSFEPKTIKVLPFLHERKIYLNPIKPNNSYFYTSIQKEFALDKFDKPVDLASKVKQKVAQSLLKAQKKQGGQSLKTTFILAVNLTESKYYVYSEKGLLVNRINFGQFIKQYGEPLTVSSNGLNYIFRNKGENVVNVIHMNEFKIHFIKRIDVKKAFWQCLNEQEKQTQSLIRINCSWVEKDNYDFEVQINNSNDVFIEFREGENLYDDQNDQTQLDTQGLRQSKSSFIGKSSRIQDYAKSKINAVYYYQAGWFNDRDPVGSRKRLKLQVDQEAPVGHSVLISKEYGPEKSKFKLSEQNIFFWTQFQIRQYPLIQSMFPHENNLLSFQIDPKQQKSTIRNIDISPFLEQIAIVVDHQEGYSTIVCWNITKNFESQGFEVDKNHLLIWDHQGYLVIINKGNTILQAQECSLKCFQIDNFATNQLTVFNENLDYDQGCRFDGQSHNWCILREYLCLPFSYMTFVIKEYLETLDGDVEEEPLLNTAFDLEPYNYIQNKTSSFLSGALVKNNHQELKLVLQNFERIDPEYLEILHYNHPNKAQKFASDEDNSIFEQLQDNFWGEGDNNMPRSSCLHYAYLEGNNRSLDILLTYLAKIEKNCSRSFMDILPLLVEQQSFYTYFENLQFQSRQMDDKHILRLEEPFSDDIVAMAASRSIYLDDNFYTNSMGEQKSNMKFKSYAINVKCLRVGWIVYEPEGVELLQAIYQNDRIEQYEMAPLHIIIENLYQKNKKIVLWTLLPLYIIQGVLFLVTIELSEMASVENAHPHVQKWRHAIAIINQIFTTLMVCIMFKTFTIMGSKFFLRVYTWIDLIFYCLNTYMCISCLDSLLQDSESQELQNLAVKKQRISGSIAVIFFLLKSFYYMKLIDAVAPLIDIIIRIMKDIGWFMVIFTLSLVCIGISYYLLGRNQVDFDSTCKADSCDDPELIKITEDDVPYSTFGGALWFMWSIVITGGELDAFELGEASQISYLKVLYIVSSFCIIIHMSNMLIAIMGETFATNLEVAHYVKIRDHLSFVLDNWFLNNPFLLTEPDNKEMYIVVASGVKAQDANEEHLQNIENSLYEQNEEISKLNKDINIIMNKQLEHETMMMNVIKNQNKMLQSFQK